MSFLGRIFGAVRELYIARPPGAETQLLYRYPNQNIPYGARITVRSDEKAAFFRYGRPLGVLEPGEHVVDTKGIPFLDPLIIRPIAGGDHFVAELFFVREAEHIHTVADRSLGTFQEPQSNLVVNVRTQARFGVRVTDPIALISTLAGQSQRADETVAEYLDARVASMLAALVGQIVGHAQIFQLISNQHSEETGQRVKALVGGEFRANGLELVRFLDLRFLLDDASRQALQSFASARADLALQREGAEVAQSPGFSAFHLAHGQRAALEGLGEGLSTGQMGPIIGGLPQLGFGGVGGGSASARRQPTVSRPLQPASPVDPATMHWYLEGPRGPEGPYTLKQLKMTLRTASPPSRGTMRVRIGFGGWQLVEDTPELTDLVVRVAPPPPGVGGASDDAFLAAVADKVVTKVELDHIVELIRRELPDVPVDELRAKVLARARAEGAIYEADGIFELFDGVRQYPGLSLERARELLAASPSKPWLVWRRDWDGWKPISDEPALRDAVSSDPTP